MRGGKLRDLLTGNIREIVFGFEDSLVSTLGAASGIAVGSGDTFTVLLAGTVLVAVEAVSMAAGSYLSSKSSSELYEERARQDATRILHARVSDEETLKAFFARKKFTKDETQAALQAIARERKLWLTEVRRQEYRFAPAVSAYPAMSGLVMGVAYVAGGSLVMLPYILLPLNQALPVAGTLAIMTLFGLGIWKANLTGSSRLRSGTEMVVVSLVAALLGIIIGRYVSTSL